jgi:membrane protease YdiL (CAAX protease family)
MNAQSIVIPWPRRIVISIVLLICGLLVFVFGTNYYSVFPTNDSQAYRAILAAIFLGAALVLRRNQSSEQYSQIAYAFFIATVAFFMTSLTAGIRDSLFSAINVPFDTPRHAALTKVFESLLVVSVILLLTALWGQDLGSLYIKKGRLGLGLFIGFSLLAINTATGIVTGATLASVVGVVASIIVTSVVFTVSHAAASYMNPVEAILFQVIIFPMALLFAYLMYKSDNVWGSALYHAGSDVFLFYLMGW